MTDDIIKPPTRVTDEDYKIWVIQKIVEKLAVSIPPEVMEKLVEKDSGPWIEINVSSRLDGIYVMTDFGLKPKKPKNNIILSGRN